MLSTKRNQAAVHIPDADFVEIRSFLAANVEGILSAIAARRSSEKIDSQDLFGMSGEDSSGVVLPWTLNFPKIPKIQILQKEKDSLGLFISGNPLEAYKEILFYVREITGKDNIHLVLVNKIKKIFTKSGVMMLALDMVSPEYMENIEGIIFPKIAAEYSPILEEAEIYWLVGRELVRKAKSVEVEGSENAQQYEQGTKIGVETMTSFVTGPISLLNKIGFDLAINRRGKIENMDFTVLRTAPEKFNPTDNLANLPLNQKPRLEQTSAA